MTQKDAHVVMFILMSTPKKRNRTSGSVYVSFRKCIGGTLYAERRRQLCPYDTRFLICKLFQEAVQDMRIQLCLRWLKVVEQSRPVIEIPNSVSLAISDTGKGERYGKTETSDRPEMNFRIRHQRSSNVYTTKRSKSSDI